MDFDKNFILFPKVTGRFAGTSHAYIWAVVLAGAVWAHAAALAQEAPLPVTQGPSWDAVLHSPACRQLGLSRAALRSLQVARTQIQSQGMDVLLHSCPQVQTAGKKQRVLALRVVVQDSEVADAIVRGPLADGVELDMGTIPPSSAEVVPALRRRAASNPEGEGDEVSPDVVFNRQWLAQLMRARGFASVGGHWWAFVPAK